MFSPSHDMFSKKNRVYCTKKRTNTVVKVVQKANIRKGDAGKAILAGIHRHSGKNHRYLELSQISQKDWNFSIHHDLLFREDKATRNHVTVIIRGHFQNPIPVYTMRSTDWKHELGDSPTELIPKDSLYYVEALIEEYFPKDNTKCIHTYSWNNVDVHVELSKRV